MTKLRLRDRDLSWRAIDDEVVAVDLRTSTYLGANATGLLLWEALALGASRDELVSKLVAEFSVDRDRAGADVDRFIEQLSEQGLLEA